MDRTRHFLQLFLAHESDLRAYVATAVRVPASRDDVMQEVALALWKSFDRYRPGQSFGAWARGVATHKVFDHHRRESRRLVLLSPEALEAVRRAFDGAETEAGGERARQEEAALGHCVDGLPPRSAELLGLRYTQGAGIPAIAERLGTSAAAVYQQLSRLRSVLGDCIRRRLAVEPHSSPPPARATRSRP
jgi:RNA polymerase sigma-70 factor (ECF subfamily)